MSQRKFKLIVADMDGTLLDDKYRVRPELIEAVKQARAKGVDLTVATGRMYLSALPHIEELQVSLPVIAANGALVKDPGTGEVISQKLLNRDLAREALRLTENSTAQRFVNIKDVYYTDASEDTVREYSKALKMSFVGKRPLEQALTEDPLMVTIRDKEDKIITMTAMLREHFGDRVYLVNSRSFFIDINHPEVSKGAALVDLCQRVGVKPAEVIAIGDGWNDREMFAAAGLGAAVANAPEAVKESADYVCVNPNFMGVIEVIERYILAGPG